MHAEVLKRNEVFESKAYSGFANPVLTPETNEAGEITTIKIQQPAAFDNQMLYYAKNYSFLTDKK